MADSNFDIWRLQSNSDIRGLIVAARDGDTDVRRRALTAIRVLGATSAIPGLQSILVTENDVDIRNMLIATLDYLFQQDLDEDGDQVSEEHNKVVHLIAQLNSENPELVIRAAQNLGELKEKIATESLVIIFHKRELPPDVRLAAAEALIQLESAPVEVSLLAAIRHTDWHHRRNAAAVLGQLAADWAVRPLAIALRDEQEIVRRTAYAALKRIGTAAAMKAIQPPETLPTPFPNLELDQPSPAVPPAPSSQQSNTSPVITPTPSPAKPEPEQDEQVDTLPERPESAKPSVEPDQPTDAPKGSPELSALEANAPVEDDDTQPSAPTTLSDDVS